MAKEPEKPNTVTSGAPPAITPTATAPTAIGAPTIDPKELQQLRDEVVRLKEREAKRGVAVRRLAAAILTPGEEADKGLGRKVKIRETLLALVEELAPE